MTVRELREKYLAFFESKNHRRFPSGSLIPIDVTGTLDNSLLFNGAGMIQFKPYFRGIATPDHPRLTTVQKCVRTGDIDEVGDATHLTFFEMLGNFSFGDYFKSEAIAFSWEFLTSKEWLGLDPSRLAFTVFESDEEAYTEWASRLEAAGIDPSTRVFRLGEETNYWPAGAFSKGPPGPCGPNSEMFYWVPNDLETPPLGEGKGGVYTSDDFIRDESAGKWVEIWNDVFIQYEWQGHENPDGKGWIKDGMPELPFRSIDTGMGLDRTAFVLAGQRSVYETDAFAPIFAKLSALTGENLNWATLDGPKGMAARIIADHVRTASFCIADGIIPGNTGRGYVLRRLIRRAVLKGQRTLGLSETFLYQVYEGVVEAMGDAYAELNVRREEIIRTLKEEEEGFGKTLRAGEERLKTLLQNGQTISGRDAFLLYGTYGFPLEVTQELAAEAGLEVDVEGYEQALEEDRLLARGGGGPVRVYEDFQEFALEDAPTSTTFTGYNATEGTGTIVRVRPQKSGDGSPREGGTVGGSAEGMRSGAPQVEGGYIALDQTPFYAKSGGQIGDTGTLTLADGTMFHVEDTTKEGGTFWHRVSTESNVEPESLLGKAVTAQVDAGRRHRIQRNHTATHLLQAALRETLGTHVAQSGSEVGPDRLRFDFAHGKAMTPAELEAVEARVNERVLNNEDVVTHVDLPIAEAKARGAMALFGEKYGDKVRMVEVGEFSRELCGGIHVRTAGEIGQFRIVSESSAAGGVRRIEAVTGEAAYQLAREESQKIKEAASLLKAAPGELVAAVERALETAKDERRKREKAEMAALKGDGGGAESVDVNGVTLWRRDFGEVDPKTAATAVDNAAANQPNQVTLAAVVSDGKIQFIAKVGPEAAAKGAHAGNLLREVAKIAGGGGGGRAEFATAGGRDASKIPDALAAAEGALKTQLS